MKSVKDKTQTCRAVFFDDEGIISKISGRVEETDGKHAWFELDDVMPFLDGKMKFSDFVVSQTKNPMIYEIIKRHVELRQRSVKSQITKILTTGSAEISISMDDTGVLNFSASDDIVKEANVNENQEVEIAGIKSHPFFVTFKGRPDFLLATIEVPFSKLLSGNTVSIQTVYDKDKISIYTKKYFNSYSMETK